MISTESADSVFRAPGVSRGETRVIPAPRGISSARQLLHNLPQPPRRPRGLWQRILSKLRPVRRRQLPAQVFVIHVAWGGLGDHLFFSHLPRIARQLGYRQVFVASDSEVRDETYRWIWALNPFVDGFTDAAPSHVTPDFAEVAEGENLLDRIMLSCGLDDGQRWHEPEFHYVPQYRPEYSDRVVYDPNYVSYVGELATSRIPEVLAAAGLHPDCQLQLRQKHHGLAGLETLATPTLFDYCDLIHSCRQFICLTSGGATLAAALGKPCTALYGDGQKPMFHHSRRHTYLRVPGSE